MALTTTTATPGDIVVPLSTIIDQLKGRLSGSEINALLEAVIAKKKDEVRPGDLITAELMNQILADLRDLNVRVTKLEGTPSTTGQVEIISVIPSGPVHLGDEMRLIGRNFGVPAQNTVTIDGAFVTVFKPDSSDTLLIFDVPPVQGVPPLGRTATLNLSNPIGFASTALYLLPGQATLPLGQIFAAMTQPPLVPKILAGQDFVFIYTVTGSTNLDETFSVAASVDQGWPAALVNDSDAPILPQEITIPMGGPPTGVNKSFRLKVTTPNGLVDGAAGRLSVKVVSKRNPAALTAAAQDLTLTVGQPPPLPQPIIVAFDNVFAPGARSGSDVTIPANNQQVRVDFKAMIKDIGGYTISAPVFDTPANWSAQLSGPNNFRTTGPNQILPLTFLLKAAPGARRTAMTFKILGADAPVSGAVAQTFVPV